MNFITKKLRTIGQAATGFTRKIKANIQLRNAKANLLEKLNKHSNALACRCNHFSDELILTKARVCELYITEVMKINPLLVVERNEFKDTDKTFYVLINAKQTLLKPHSLDNPQDIPEPTIPGDPPSEAYLDGLWKLDKRVNAFGVKAPLVSFDKNRFPDYLSVKAYLDKKFDSVTNNQFEVAKPLIDYIDEQIFLTNRAGGRYVRINLHKLPTHLHFLIGEGWWYSRMSLYRYYRNDGFIVDETYYVNGVDEKLELYIGW